MKVLVTGGTGFTGKALTKELVRRGNDVRIFDLPGQPVCNFLNGRIDLVEGDIRNRDAVVQAAEGMAAIYHIAAVFKTAGHLDKYYYDVNVGGMENVIHAAREQGVERTIYCSTVGVHGDVKEIPCREDSPLNPGDIYQRTKLEGEQVFLEAFSNGLPGVICRPASIYGPGDLRLLKLFKTIHSGLFRMIGSGDVLLHLVYIDDLVDGIIRCGEHPNAIGKTYILAGPDYIPLKEIVNLIAKAVGTPIRSGNVPVSPIMAVATVCEAICCRLGIEPPLHRRRVAFFTNSRAFSNEKAIADIGYAPNIDAAEGIRRTAAWYKERGLL